MKKRMSVLMNGVLFCISAALVLFLAIRICSGSISFGDIPIGFSENGDVLHFFGELLYISRKDVKLPEGRYFVADLIGCTVNDADTGKRLGTLTEVSETGANDVYEITDDGGIVYLMPAVKSMVIDVNIETGEMKIRPIAGIFDDAD